MFQFRLPNGILVTVNLSTESHLLDAFRPKVLEVDLPPASDILVTEFEPLPADLDELLVAGA